MAQYTVVKTEVNKFGFGNVFIEGGETLHAKGKWGYSTGKKAIPPCVAGDVVEAELDLGKYPAIKNIQVIGKADVAKAKSPKKAGAEFRTPAQIMRTSALELAIANGEDQMTVEEIMLFADELYLYIDKGNSPVATDQMDNPDDDIPF